MTRTENSRSLNQKFLCAAPKRDEEGRKNEGRGESGREKKESESGDIFFRDICAFLPLLVFHYVCFQSSLLLPTILYLSCR